MRNALLALVLSAGAALPAQFPCTTAPAAPAVFLTCPCDNAVSPLSMSFLGTGRIGTTIRFSFSPSFVTYDHAVMVVGVPTSLPLSLPPGIVACTNGAPVPTLHFDPMAAYLFLNPGVTQAVNYWLYLPADPNLVGFTIAAQGFSHQIGVGSVPFYPTALIGLTILP